MADPFRHLRARVNGVELHYLREGKRGSPPLLLLHGWPGFWFEWHKVIAPLAERFDVVVPDMRGYGLSEKPDLPAHVGYNDRVMAEDLRALLDHLGWERASAAGHDFGAVWLQTLVREHPERLSKLVLFDPPYGGIGLRALFPGRAREFWYILFHQMFFAEWLVGSSPALTRRYIGHFLSHWSHRKDLWTAEEIEEYVKVYSQPGALRGGFNCYRAAARAPGRLLNPGPRIRVPTLVLWAENDSILPAAWADNLPKFFKDVRVKRVPECGHFMMRERPDVVVREVTEFVLGR